MYQGIDTTKMRWAPFAEDIISGTHSSVKQTVEINRVKTNDEITLPLKPKKQEFGINCQKF